MGYETYIALAILLLIAGLIVWYLIRQKKKGKKCIGCPYADQCSGHCGDGKR